MRVVVLISLAILFQAAVAHAEPQMLPEAAPEEKNATYNAIYEAINSQAGKGANVAQPYLMIGMALQMMPADDRQKLVMDVAKDIQTAPKQERLKGLEGAAGILRTLTPTQHTNLMTQAMQTLSVMTQVEQQIIGVQLNKLLVDLQEVPQEDRAALSPVMNSIISKALARQ